MKQNENHSLKPFFILWGGQAISLLGSQLVQFALIWWLTATTGSATVLAMASLAGLLPQVVLGPFVGVLVDRGNRRLTMLMADTAVAGATIVLLSFFWAGSATVWQVFVILFVRALAGTFHFTAMTASTSLMVPEQHLTRIQGLNQMLYGGLNIIAAPLGALLLEVLPMYGILGIDVGTAVFAILPLFFIAVPQPKRTEIEGDSGEFMASFWADMREGIQYIRGWRGLLILTGMAMIIKIVLNPAFALIPLLVTDHFGGGALQLGFMEAAAGIGIVSGGLSLGAWGGFKQRVWTIVAGLVGLGVSLTLLGATPAEWFPMAIVTTLGIGFSIPFVDGPLMAILQATIAPEMQGRVFNLFGSLVTSTVPLGLVMAGPLADVIGIRAWFIAAGILTLAATAVSLFVPSFMTIEDYEGTAVAECQTTPIPESAEPTPA